MAQRSLSCILLAAGMSTRMGDMNKLLLEYHGKTVIRHTAELLTSYGFTEIIVVVGHQAEIIAPELQGLPLKLAFNADYEQGQMTSVHAGLRKLSRDCDGIMVCLGDLVLLNEDDLAALHNAFNRTEKSIVVPMFEGERGNPIILDATHREAIVAGEKNLGCRKLIAKNPDEVDVFHAESDHVTFDIDTPARWQEFNSRLTSSVQAQQDDVARELTA